MITQPHTDHLDKLISEVITYLTLPHAFVPPTLIKAKLYLIKSNSKRMLCVSQDTKRDADHIYKVVLISLSAQVEAMGLQIQANDVRLSEAARLIELFLSETLLREDKDATREVLEKIKRQGMRLIGYNKLKPIDFSLLVTTIQCYLFSYSAQEFDANEKNIVGIFGGDRLTLFADEISNPTFAWITGEDNKNWAYGNNAMRLSSVLDGFCHVMDGSLAQPTVAFFFDIKLMLRSNIRGAINIVRVGGPNPVNSLYGKDWSKGIAGFGIADLVIATNETLRASLAQIHDNVILLQNALDLDAWPYSPLESKSQHKFTIGYSASVPNAKESNFKGLDIFKEIVEELRIEHIIAGKGAKQIPYRDMREEFYSKIDLLVHPVREGKEGCSNTIMESLASGTPVLTTRHCGYHAEQNSEAIFLEDVDPYNFINKIKEFLTYPERKRIKLSVQARLYAEENHNLQRVSATFKPEIFKLFRDICSPKVAFIPFWGSQESAAATTRLRALLPARLLSHCNYNVQVLDELPKDNDFDIIVINQLATLDTISKIRTHRQLVVYDVCDIYFDDNRTLRGVVASKASQDLMRLSHVVTASTPALASLIRRRFPDATVDLLLDGLDYNLGIDDGKITYTQMHKDSFNNTCLKVCWFGNPGRGNLECVSSFLEEISYEDNIDLTIFASNAKLEKWPKLQKFAKRWIYSEFILQLSGFDISILGHHLDTELKSINRMVVSVWAGQVPLIVEGQAYKDILNHCGLDWLYANDYARLHYALNRLRDRSTRQTVVKTLKQYLEIFHSDSSILSSYVDLLSKYDGLQCNHKPKKVVFVSHNLNVQEGAPNSLVDLAIGLNNRADISSTVYSLYKGDLSSKLEKFQVPCQYFANIDHLNQGASERLLRMQFQELCQNLKEYLLSVQPDVVILNTSKTLALSSVASGLGIPCINIIRESLENSLRLDFGSERIASMSHNGMLASNKLVFVSKSTQQLWQETYPDIRESDCIPNGIDHECFSRVCDDESEDDISLDKNRLVLLCVGTVNKRKRQRDIIEAVNMIKKSIAIPITIQLVGSLSDSYSSQIESRASALFKDYDVVVKLIPPTRDIGRYYSNADIFVFCSENESYPRVIVEAMLFGLPIISSKAFGTTEQIRDGIDGLMYQPGRIGQLAKHILALCTDISQRDYFSRMAKLRYYGLTSRNSMLSQYAALINRVTSSMLPLMPGTFPHSDLTFK